MYSEALLRIFRKIFKSWKFRYSVDPNRYRRKIENLRKAFLRRVRRPPSQNDRLNIKTRFDDVGAKRYFLFLERDDVPPTNNASEQAIRFVVIDRKATMGTRSNAGMRFCERLLLPASNKGKVSFTSSKTPSHHPSQEHLTQNSSGKTVKGYLLDYLLPEKL
jgi:hypothetical protein